MPTTQGSAGWAVARSDWEGTPTGISQTPRLAQTAGGSGAPSGLFLCLSLGGGQTFSFLPGRKQGRTASALAPGEAKDPFSAPHPPQRFSPNVGSETRWHRFQKQPLAACNHELGLEIYQGQELRVGAF